MSLVNCKRPYRVPTHPGAMLREDFFPEYNLTVSSAARLLGVSRQSINELVREKRAVSPEMALRLSRLFGNSADVWLNAQRELDLWLAEKAIKDKLEQIETIQSEVTVSS
ncbi:addiction module antidote protein, HigA family [Lysobacter sp. N42]|nr:addiction module antidote protein, HigA family [Aliidiomarina sp. B3213]TCZ93420.1 addiction module antidote protein, HigA family [Lysobacter sp. N42]